MAEIIRWHHLKKCFFFHLLTIRRSAKAVFCDRRHLLKFSLQQDLWTKIITNIVFQSFRLCSRTALQVLSTEYTLWLLWPKNWKGEDFVSASVDSCTPALPMLTSTTTQATETKHDLWICKKYFSSGTDFTQQGLQSKEVFYLLKLLLTFAYPLTLWKSLPTPATMLCSVPIDHWPEWGTCFAFCTRYIVLNFWTRTHGTHHYHIKSQNTATISFSVIYLAVFGHHWQIINAFGKIPPNKQTLCIFLVESIKRRTRWGKVIQRGRKGAFLLF